jgi:peptidoglycan/xylan/chitin deacetylase (PgdA/CDA1 family)
MVISGCSKETPQFEVIKKHNIINLPIAENVKHISEEEFVKRIPIILEPEYYVNRETYWYVKPIKDAPKKMVLITIDDAPDKYSLEMAHILKSLDAKAIFFVNGHFIDSDEEKAILKAIYELGFEIANHTWSHKRLDKMSEEMQRKSIVELNDAIEAIIGERPKFFRAPHGINTDYALKVVEEEKMLVMNWSYGYDFNKKYMEKEALTDIMLNTPLLGNGANLLLHDRSWSRDALKDIVVGLREKGYGILNPDLIQVPK